MHLSALYFNADMGLEFVEGSDRSTRTDGFPGIQSLHFSWPFVTCHGPYEGASNLLLAFVAIQLVHPPGGKRGPTCEDCHPYVYLIYLLRLLSLIFSLTRTSEFCDISLQLHIGGSIILQHVYTINELQEPLQEAINSNFVNLNTEVRQMSFGPMIQ